MLQFLRSSGTPAALRALHVPQFLLTLPSIPITIICLLGLLASGFNLVFLVQFPWLLSALSLGVLLWKERRAAGKGELTRRRYLVLQLLKAAWSGLFFAPLAVAYLATSGFKTRVWIIVHLKTEWEWRMMLWFNGLHWIFIATSLLYGAIFFKGQVEGTIRLRTDEPIGLDVDRSIANDEAIARQLQANEPDWEV